MNVNKLMQNLPTFGTFCLFCSNVKELTQISTAFSLKHNIKKIIRFLSDYPSLDKLNITSGYITPLEFGSILIISSLIVFP